MNGFGVSPVRKMGGHHFAVLPVLDEPANEERKEPLDRVGVIVATDVFLDAVPDGAMERERPTEALVHLRVISHEHHATVNVRVKD